MRNLRLAAAALTLCLAGCATPVLPPLGAATSPLQWYSPLPHNGALGDLTQWWQQFDDPCRTALAAETALVSLQRERVAAWIALYRAVGGGWGRPDAAPA